MISTLLRHNKVRLGLCLVLFSVSGSVFAAPQVSVSVSPTIYDMTANPGQMWQSTIRIINPNPFPLTLTVTPQNFVPKDEDGVPQFIPLNSEDVVKDTLGEWLSITSEITVGPEQTYELPFLISVPETAPPGGQYAAILIGTKPSDTPGDVSRVETAQVISALIFLRITGDIRENSTIRSFRTASLILSKPETTFEVRVENRGNVHLQPQGEIKIYNMWGQERGVIPVNQQTMLGNVLPQSVRKFSFPWSSEWTLTDIGRFTAKVTLAYGKEDRQFLSADTSFWVIPWKPLLLIGGIIGGLILLVSVTIKFYIRRVLLQAGVSTTKVTEPAKKSPKQSSKHTITEKTPLPVSETTVTKMARLSVSLLDLRRPAQSQSLYERLVKNRLLPFVLLHKKLVLITFSVLVTGVVAGVILLNLIASSDTATIATDSESVGSGIADDSIGVESANGLPITIINRSRNPAAGDKVATLAQSVGFTVATSTSEEGAPAERTVIVYNPAVGTEVALLSRVLNNALLSAFTTTSTSTEMIVVYVGNDITISE